MQGGKRRRRRHIALVAAGIDVHKMSLTVTVLSEDEGGEMLTATREYRTYGRELEELRQLARLHARPHGPRRRARVPPAVTPVAATAPLPTST